MASVLYLYFTNHEYWLSIAAQERDRDHQEQPWRQEDHHVRMERQGPRQDGVAPLPLSGAGVWLTSWWTVNLNLADLAVWEPRNFSRWVRRSSFEVHKWHMCRKVEWQLSVLQRFQSGATLLTFQIMLHYKVVGKNPSSSSSCAVKWARSGNN